MSVNVKDLKPFIQLTMSFLEPRIAKSDNKLDDLGLATVKVCLASDEWLAACQAAIDSGVSPEQIASSMRAAMGLK